MTTINNYRISTMKTFSLKNKSKIKNNSNQMVDRTKWMDETKTKDTHHFVSIIGIGKLPQKSFCFSLNMNMWEIENMKKFNFHLIKINRSTNLKTWTTKINEPKRITSCHHRYHSHRSIEDGFKRILYFYFFLLNWMMTFHFRGKKTKQNQ